MEVSAPGKLVLFGEYAVLFGAPAVVAAVDRRAVVTLCPSTGVEWQVSAPGLAPRPGRFGIGAGARVRWQDEELGRNTFGLVERLLDGINKSLSMDLETLPVAAMTLDTRAFFEGAGGEGSKLGLGSSAALTVALASALEAWAGGSPTTEPEGRMQRLVDLHRQVQGGVGSGIDVAASLLGGVVRFQLGTDGAVTEAKPLALPEQLRMVFVWTGRAASTGDFLGRLRARQEEERQVVDPVLDELAAVSVAGVAALADDDAEGFLDAVDAFWRALDQLGHAIAMPILSEEHQTLRRIAVDCGVRYKPSGAGGGDFGVGFAIGADAVAELRSRAEAGGFRVLELALDKAGLMSSS
jgi:phosphomevalonate kinase